MATASLTLAIAGWVYPASTNHEVTFALDPAMALIQVGFPPLAAVLGHIAIYRIRRDRAGGHGRAVSGLVIAYLQIALIVAGLVYGLVTS